MKNVEKSVRGFVCDYVPVPRCDVLSRFVRYFFSLGCAMMM